jgi:hypothetical protein
MGLLRDIGYFFRVGSLIAVLVGVILLALQQYEAALVIGGAGLVIITLDAKENLISYRSHEEGYHRRKGELEAEDDWRRR